MVLAIFSPSPAIGGKAAPDKAAPRTSKRGRQILPANAKILQVAGHTGFLALPKDVKVGRKTPWLWYFPSDYNLPGKLEQWMIDKCLANGIAVAGIDLSGDLGTPAGRATLTAFHKEVTQNRGLTKKACMLARSYGGTQMYNWAAEHPESVACLAGIYPVCNMASYPGLKSAAGKYRMSQEKFVKELKRHNPIDRLAPLAKAKVPIYHNTGDIDTLVPPKDNSFLLAKRYKALGGDITVTVFKGQGHNYWPGFFEDKAMAAFIIKHAKRVASFPRVLIVGDSISGGYGKPLIKLLDGKADVTKLGSVAGYRIQTETFWHSRGTAKYLDFGSAKACIADFERFERHLKETKYDVIHFNFGLNDIFRGRKGAWHNPVDQYAKDLTRIVTLLKKNGAKVIWASTTPIPANAPHMPVGDDLIYNAAAEKVMKKNNIPINDLHSVVTDWDGYAKWKKGNDVHFSGGVYSKLAEQIAKTIAGALVEQPPARTRSFGSMQKTLEPSKVLTYKTIGQRKLTLHIFHPKGIKAGDRRPVYVVFHGGAWRSGTPRRFYPYAASLVPDGFVGVSAEYRLTGPATTVFDCVKDGRAAIRYIRRHAKDLGIDPGRITVGGGSAGGHVALGTALFDTVEHADEDLRVSCKPNALVLLFSVLDTSPEGYGNKVIGAEWRKISPLHQIRPKMPPTLIFHGDKDNVAPYPTLMAFCKKMRDSKNVCELVLQPGGVHGHINNDMKLFDDAANRTRTFLSKQQLGPSRPR
jgi:acetyl esterase